jgi:hypothetical protein
MMKKKIVNILMLLVISLMTFSCSEDEVVMEPSLEVTPITMQGTWKLAELNGEQVPEDFYIYIIFDRKRNFEMYQKHDSMYPRYITGTYSIEKDSHYGYILSGEYDYENGDWNNKYIVTDLLQSGSMVWTVKDGDEVSKYVRVDEVPEEIVEAAKVDEEQ